MALKVLLKPQSVHRHGQKAKALGTPRFLQRAVKRCCSGDLSRQPGVRGVSGCNKCDLTAAVVTGGGTPVDDDVGIPGRVAGSGDTLLEDKAGISAEGRSVTSMCPLAWKWRWQVDPPPRTN